MNDSKFDPASVAKMRKVLDSIPPQTSPRAQKALDEFNAAVKRIESENKRK